MCSFLGETSSNDRLSVQHTQVPHCISRSILVLRRTATNLVHWPVLHHTWNQTTMIVWQVNYEDNDFCEIKRSPFILRIHIWSKFNLTANQSTILFTYFNCYKFHVSVHLRPFVKWVPIASTICHLFPHVSRPWWIYKCGLLTKMPLSIDIESIQQLHMIYTLKYNKFPYIVWLKPENTLVLRYAD